MTRNILTRIIKDESGATAIEYGLILAFMAGAIIAVFGALSGNLKTLFGDVGTKLQVQTP
jgi:pilus assembly protein Flp/PilA